MNKIRERKLTPSLLRYLETHFSIVGFIDGPIIQCSDGNYINRAGPGGIEVADQWIAYSAANSLCFVE